MTCMAAGRVVHKRSVSKKLVFIDITDITECRIALVFKLSECGQEVMTRASKSASKIHVGDWIEVEGKQSSSGMHEILVKDFIVLERWSDISDMPFVPIPPVTASLPSGGSSSSTKVGVCKYWRNTGRCPLENDCAYSHMIIEATEGSESDAHGGDVSRHQRARVFADWIVKVFPGTNSILDVGGGKGDMAFELGLKRGVPCSVVDPRNPKKFETKILPKWQRKVLSRNPNFTYTHFETKFNTDFCDQNWTSSESDGRSLVIGMHPDEATEAIVDLCIKFKRDFAVVPCCVFAHQFPDRKLKSGVEPKTYEQFFDYLVEKHADIQQDQLNSACPV